METADDEEDGVLAGFVVLYVVSKMLRFTHLVGLLLSPVRCCWLSTAAASVSGAAKAGKERKVGGTLS